MQVPFCLRASGLGPISTSVGCPLPPSFLEADEGDQGHPHGQRRSPVMHKRSSRKHGNRGHVRTGGPPGNLFPNLSYPGFGPEPARPQRSGKHKAAEMDAAARQHSPVTRRVSGDAAVARSDPAPPGGTAGTTAAQAGSSRLRGGGEGRVGARPGPAPAAGRGDTHLGRAGRPRRPHLSHPRGGRRPSPAAPAPPRRPRHKGRPRGGRTGVALAGAGVVPEQARPPPPDGARRPAVPCGRRVGGRPPGGRATGAAPRPPAAGPDWRGGGARAPQPRGRTGAQPWLRQEVRGRGRRRARPMAAAGRRWAPAAPRRGLRPGRAAGAGLGGRVPARSAAPGLPRPHCLLRATRCARRGDTAWTRQERSRPRGTDECPGAECWEGNAVMASSRSHLISVLAGKSPAFTLGGGLC